MAENPKTAEGQKKRQLALVPPSAIDACAQAFEDGARKYGAYNWRKTGVPYMTYLHAAKRHLDALLDGEDVAPDSGVHHAGHVMACMAVVVDAIKCGKLEDDRPPAPGEGETPPAQPPLWYRSSGNSMYLYEKRLHNGAVEVRAIAHEDGTRLGFPGNWHEVDEGYSITLTPYVPK